MIISKSDLYKTEWLDVVFAKRNKAYGAYDLRKHNSRTISKAMLITFTTVTSLFLGLSYVVGAKNHKLYHVVEVDNSARLKKVDPPKDEKIHQMETKHAAAPKQTVSTTKFVPPVVTTEPVTEDPPKLIDIKGAVGQETVDLGAAVGIAEPGMIPGGKGEAVTEEKVDNTVYPSVDIEPEPVGGMAAWNKFLQKNMRYPAQALDAQKSGRVFLTFVVEKDGHITDIKVMRGPGYGMDDEALRVLKLAPLWKPGVQHGRQVRVQFTLPFNFTLDQ